MKFLNKVLCLTAFFAMGSVSAKRIDGARAAATAPAASVVKPGAPAVKAETQGRKSFKQLRDAILGMKFDSFKGEKLNPTLIKSLETQAKDNYISKNGFLVLLQTARDKFIIFSGNNEKDIEILKQVNAEISGRVNSFSPSR